MSDVASLTRTEAEERASLITVGRYDIAVDMRDLFEGETLHSTSTVTFTCSEPGASTFVDCVAEIHEATLNGRALDLATSPSGRLPLPDLAADNVLVVRASRPTPRSGAGILRTVDPSDKLVYVWTSFEPDAARRVWACFDQPDLKAPHRFTVHGAGRLDGHQQRRPGVGRGPRRRRPGLDVPGHPAAVDVRRGRQRRPVPRDPRAARRPQPRPLLPAVAQAAPRARRPGAPRRSPRRASPSSASGSAAVPAGALRPGLRAQHGRRDGELGLRHLDRQRAVPQPAHPRASGRWSPACCCTRWRTCGSATW